jgi:hypothetical protein
MLNETIEKNNKAFSDSVNQNVWEWLEKSRSSNLEFKIRQLFQIGMPKIFLIYNSRLLSLVLYYI